MVKTQFGIKDLENLSQVKAHTIRIWEKRYNLLEPDRTDTNIRKYDLENLKKLLNIVYLYNAGHKISKLAKLKPTDLQQLIKENIVGSDNEYSQNLYKSAMLEFDGDLFDTTFQKNLEEKSFRQVFAEIFAPLLNETGVLWHSGTIDPSHEHFLSEKIKHAIIRQSLQLNAPVREDAKTFVLYLPYGEIHEIGLLYANYELQAAGHNTIYLGANIPLDSLKNVLRAKKEIICVTYFTVYPEQAQIDQYIEQFEKEVCQPNPCELWVLGKRDNTSTKFSKNIKFIPQLDLFIEQLSPFAKPE